MRNRLALLLVTVLLVFAGCSNKPKTDIEGLWQLQQLEINGTVITEKMLGKWTWEFKGGGRYESKMGHTEEEGTYSVEGQMLTLKSETMDKRPAQVMTILRLDSVQMDLKASDEKNSSSLSFRKVQK
ncbi:MAG TPA: lipocalin family protein [Chitinophagales bacterium]|nr:lipocalin family protein [Chitinophagales bacterium]